MPTPPPPQISTKRPAPLPPLLLLPPELIDQILTLLPTHTDLISFALTSRASLPLVVPHHTEYRTLRLRHQHHAVWAHLARRSDLARNVREVHLRDRGNQTAPDRVPKTLVPPFMGYVTTTTTTTTTREREEWGSLYPPPPPSPTTTTVSSSASSSWPWTHGGGSEAGTPSVSPRSATFPSEHIYMNAGSAPFSPRQLLAFPSPVTPSFPNFQSLSSDVSGGGGGGGGGGYGDGEQEVDPEWARTQNICTALSYMVHLHTFTWSSRRPTAHPSHEAAILETVAKKLPMLDKVGLDGRFGVLMGGVLSATSGGVGAYPVWSFRNLNALSLIGDAWTRPSNAPFLLEMLNGLVQLETLEIAMEFPLLSSLHLPSLKHLHLPLHAGAVQGIDGSRAAFIARHSTLQSLDWFPISMTPTHNLATAPWPGLWGGGNQPVAETSTPQGLTANSLPALERLRTTLEVWMSFFDGEGNNDTNHDRDSGQPGADDSSSLSSNDRPPPTSASILEPLRQRQLFRSIRSLEIHSMCAEDLLAISNSLDTGALKQLKLHRIRTIAGVEKLAEVFLGLTWLYLPEQRYPGESEGDSSAEGGGGGGGESRGDTGSVGEGGNGEVEGRISKLNATAGPVPIDPRTWIDLLPRFRRLQVFKGHGLWKSVNMHKPSMHALIMVLVERCLELRELDHCEVYEKRHDWKRVVVFRETVYRKRLVVRDSGEEGGVRGGGGGGRGGEGEGGDDEEEKAVGGGDHVAQGKKDGAVDSRQFNENGDERGPAQVEEFEEIEEQRVWYEVQKPPVRDYFDTMCGVFD